nr:hypothetical protein [Candidatus Microthrix sp.]
MRSRRPRSPAWPPPFPADLAILSHPDFAAIEHSTKWVEDGRSASPASVALRSPRTPTMLSKWSATSSSRSAASRFDVKMLDPR